MPKVSVIIPVYNVEPYLRRSMESVCNQTLKDIEIICINDASTDKSLDILREYEQKDNRVKVINLEENQGAAVARNKGLDISTGEYLGFIDPDDEIVLNYYEELYKKAKEEDADIVKCKIRNIELNNEVLYGRLNDKIKEKGKYYFTCEWQTAIYRHSLIKENNIRFPEECRKAQDVVFLNRVVFKANKLVLIDNVEYIYYKRNDSLNSKKIPLESIQSALKANSLRIEVLNESDLYEKDKITYIDLFNAKFNVLFGLTLFQNDSIEAKQLCAKWLIETYYECKDKNLLDTVFRYKRLLPLIKNKDEKRLLNIIKNYKNYSDLQKEQIKFIQKIFSIMNEKDYKIITIFGIRIKLKRKASKENIIISLTSYPARIKTVSKTIKTLLNQTMKADKVILWLSEEEFPNKEKDLPQELLDLKNNNFSFEIDWCENIKSYKKLIPALKKYPNSVIITADDDLLYEPDRVKLLYKEHLKHPKDVICHRAHFITFSKNKINEYKNWIQNFRFNITSNNLFPTTGAMALYPINSLYKDVLDKSLFYNLAYNTDDIWFWAMCILNDTKIRLAKGHISSLTKIENTQEDVLWHDNVNNGRNDKNLKLMFEYYPMLYKKISKRKHIHYSIQDIFSLTNSIDKRHKIITILGIKIKIKRNLSKK